MRNIWMLLLAAVLCLSACDRAPDAPSATPDERAAARAADDAPGETAQAENEQLVTGTVVYYDGLTLAICANDNTNLNFLVADSETDQGEARGLVAGSKADVYYIGEINGSNTSAAQVTKLAQSSEQAKAGTDRGVVGGVIVSADASVLNMLSFESEELTFLIVDEGIDMEHTDGLTTGDYVTVFYDGKIGGAEPVNVVKIVQ